MLYAALTAWAMNSRGAIMKDYPDFSSGLHSHIAAFEAIESAADSFTWTDPVAALSAVSPIYDSLSLMRSGLRLISTSKCLHFVFPTMYMPMDGTNTLTKLYGNSGESKWKYLEVLQFAYDVLAGIDCPQQYLDDRWNTCETKLVDNAIILWTKSPAAI